MLEFVTTCLTSSLYLMGIIGCAVHNRQPLVRKLLWLLIPRWASLFLDIYLFAMAWYAWDRGRTSRWSTKLYGKVEENLWQKSRVYWSHPSIATKFIPLLIGSLSFGLHRKFGWVWAKWFGIIMFAELAFRIVYTAVAISVFIWVARQGWSDHFQMADLSDLPEDLTNFSRRWEENNKNTWAQSFVEKRVAKRKKEAAQKESRRFA